MYRKEIVIQDQENSLRRNFEKNQITVIEGIPRFQSAKLLEITPADSSEKYEITATIRLSPLDHLHEDQNGLLLTTNASLIQTPFLTLNICPKK